MLTRSAAIWLHCLDTWSFCNSVINVSSVFVRGGGEKKNNFELVRLCVIFIRVLFTRGPLWWMLFWFKYMTLADKEIVIVPFHKLPALFFKGSLPVYTSMEVIIRDGLFFLRIPKFSKRFSQTNWSSYKIPCPVEYWKGWTQTHPHAHAWEAVHNPSLCQEHTMQHHFSHSPSLQISFLSSTLYPLLGCLKDNLDVLNFI